MSNTPTNPFEDETMPAGARRIHFCFASLVLVSGLFLATASAQLTASPASLSFTSTYVGLDTTTKGITVKNEGTTSTTITAITPSCPEFKLGFGATPVTLAPGKTTSYDFYFAPDAAQTFNCDYTVTTNGASNVVVPVSGTGLQSNALVSVSPTSLSFPNQAVGTNSAAQSITISNTGTGAVKLTAVTIVPPTFSYSTSGLPITINANSSATIKVGYTPAYGTSQTGVIGFTFDQVPPKVVDLSGNGDVSSSLVITNIATLPAATQGAAYQGTILAESGTAPYSFSLKPGSVMPAGLSISSAGLISGTVSSTAAIQNYTFSIGVKDANSKTTSKTFTLGVSKTTGAACNNIWWDIANTTTPITPLTDLATGSYLGEEGGLYLSGSNVRPPAHDTDGQIFAKGIVPLDANGNYSPTGKYVMLGIGESTAQDEFTEFLSLARVDPELNSSLVIVDGAQGGATPHELSSTSSPYWNTMINNYIPDQGVTANQVVAVWVEDTNGITSGTFPHDMVGMQTDYETLMNNVHTLFPNVKLAYFSSRIYAGYSDGVAKIDPEPYAYEAGFAVKNAIGDQLNGNLNLNYNPNLGPIMAPWMSWGPYYWADGLLARSDGWLWTCQDLQSDGTHPSSPSGDLKVAGQLLNFFKTDDTTTPWFLQP